MTSSLVGSEMCIRDRGNIGIAVPTALDDADCPNWHLGEAACHVGREAVSYTHLTLPTICSV
eukprot:5233598-Prorocentrum_lima.AAC.1